MDPLQNSTNNRAFVRLNPKGHRQVNERSPGIVTMPDGSRVRVRSRHRFFVSPGGQVVTNPFVARGRVSYATAVLPASFGDKAPLNTGVNGSWVKVAPGSDMGILHRGSKRHAVRVLRVQQEPAGMMRAKVRYIKHDRRGEGRPRVNPYPPIQGRTRRTVSLASSGGGSKGALVRRVPGLGFVSTRVNPDGSSSVASVASGSEVVNILRDVGSGRSRVKFSLDHGLQVVPR